ncbi:MAG: D-aminoacyl-tRNA deacylase [Firmicutes bacterium]|jgi:D-tyrosyl-tRNA(Tyr) deacylase|uniref:D-aminoacyl-tRNA deacylase n=1 Tax=Candidatus Colimorpha enterica TaxID=3083063 RepID=A0AAE3K4L5_9BACT|nr:D-aminoacyl-tRNA deacylase [Candidatus Colimorpha enterica]MDD6322593.1 D-aminoacyl-tRNA deacylase [Bacillota bacterium]MDY2906093.1 D-aminoacyl-tRNA deacylase [Eubacteriales bacterium]
MRAVVQRVSGASVAVSGETVGKCGRGFLILLGVAKGDTEADADVLAAKLSKLRVFEDGNGKMNLSLSDIGGELLIISNFTLYADCRHGNRPDFLMAEAPAEANRLYEYFTDRMKTLSGCPTETGVFGADMKVSIENDGPVTLVIDSPELMKKKGGAG